MATAASALARHERNSRARRAPGAPSSARGPVTRLLGGRAAPMHVLMVELLAGSLLVGIRAVADYEVRQTGAIKGKIGHPKGQLGPLPILAGLLMAFFVLSFLAAGAGDKARAKVAVAFGALIDIALALHSSAEIDKVATIFGGKFATAKTTSATTSSAVTSTGPPTGAVLV